MTKYCSTCKMPKSKHQFYIIQGNIYMNCDESKCEDIMGKFVSKKELLELDMNHSKDTHDVKCVEDGNGS